jgi:hypothetical protein
LPLFFFEKLQVKVESNYKKGKEMLLEIIEPDVLPAFLGGEYTGEWRMLPGGGGGGGGPSSLNSMSPDK